MKKKSFPSCATEELLSGDVIYLEFEKGHHLLYLSLGEKGKNEYEFLYAHRAPSGNIICLAPFFKGERVSGNKI